MANLEHEEQLQKIFTNVNEWLKFAEAKNFGLLTLSGALVFGFTQIDFCDDSIISVAGNYVFIPVALFSFLFSIISLFPILSKIQNNNQVNNWIVRLSNLIDKETVFENIHYYGYLRTLDEPTFEIKFLSKIGSTDAFTEYETELSTQILYNSRITWFKYQFFKIAAFIFLWAIILSVFALPIIALVKK
ncbi:MAG: hypothetical protein K0R36_173 [Chryseobacterium sp.]|jgi:hypothetical protein|nr:hypothetical protein [Chryseobacterium sp.]